MKLKKAFRFIQCNRNFNVAYVRLHNSGMLGLGKSGNVSGVSNASLQQHCDSMFFSILFLFSALEGPAKELRLSFMLSEK